MTDDERQERLRKLTERRSESGRSGGPAPTSPDTEVTQLLDEQAERIRRLQERRAASAPTVADTQPLDVPSTDSNPATAFSARQVDSIERPRKTRRFHKAEASRIASAGAGIALTVSLMSSMAGAEANSVDVAQTTEGEPALGTPVAAPVPPATSQAPSTLAAATPRGPVPVILAPIQVRVRVVSGGSSGGAVAVGGNQPAPGGAVVTPQPAPAL
ncbi:MAG: hypothetical protein ACFCVC_13025, partial [Acidimicrobiia bacterium]